MSCVIVNSRWRFGFFAFVTAMVAMWFFVGTAQWNDAKDQRNKMRRHNAKLRERVTVLEQQIVINPNKTVVKKVALPYP